MTDDLQDLGLLLETRTRLVVVESWDEAGVLQTLAALAMRRGLNLHTWSCTSGLVALGLAEGEEGPAETRDAEVALRQVRSDPRPNLYAFCDLHPFLEDSPRIVRAIKEIAMADGPHHPTLFLVSHALKLPPELQHHAARFSFALPCEEDLERILEDEARHWREQHRGALVQADGQALAELKSNLRGLPHRAVRLLARRIIWDDGAITAKDLPALLKQKFQFLDLQGVLSFEAAEVAFEDVGGLEHLKHWLALRRHPFLDPAQQDMPKGMLLVGVQGSGKSLAAKAVAGTWGLPLMRLDFGCLYNKFFGETERNLREALKQADLMAPCVLWMDELEKGLSIGVHDEGVSQRLLGSLLTWMAERTSRVFLVATTNDIQKLPPELVRKGRFDEVFFVDLPDAATRGAILAIHLRRRNLDPDHLDLPTLVAASEGFSGAEIEQAIVSAFYACQARQAPCTSSDILQAMHQSTPLAVLMAERMELLRAWARGRAVQA